MPKNKVYPRSFFLQPTEHVARQLLGSLLVHHTPEGTTSGFIIETEAYLGASDPASHTHKGETPRTAAMFGEPGYAYIYFIYGNHFCLNVSTQEPGTGEGVLIRALLPHEGIELMRQRRKGAHDHNLTNGPGKLCQALGIDRNLYGHDFSQPPLQLFQAEPNWLEKNHLVVQTTPRIGISQAQDKLLRFVAAPHEHPYFLLTAL